MPIVIDEQFINGAIAKLTTMRDKIDVVKTGRGQYLDQTLAELSVFAGTDQFEPGKTIRAQVDKTGDTLTTRLDNHYNTLDGLVNALQSVVDEAGYTESLNTVSPEEFSAYLPSTGATTTA